MLTGQYNTLTNPSGKLQYQDSITDFYTGRNASFENIAGQKTKQYFKNNGVANIPKSTYDFNMITGGYGFNVLPQNVELENLQKDLAEANKKLKNTLNADVSRYLEELYTGKAGIFKDIITIPSGQVDLKEETLKREIDTFKSRVDKLNIDKRIRDQIFSFGLANILQRVGQELTSVDSMTGQEVADEQRVRLNATLNGTEPVITMTQRPQTIRTFDIASVEPSPNDLQDRTPDITPMIYQGAGTQALITPQAMKEIIPPRVRLPQGVSILQPETDLARQNIEPIAMASGRPRAPLQISQEQTGNISRIRRVNMNKNYTRAEISNLTKKQLTRMGVEHNNPDMRKIASEILSQRVRM